MTAPAKMDEMSDMAAQRLVTVIRETQNAMPDKHLFLEWLPERRCWRISAIWDADKNLGSALMVAPQYFEWTDVAEQIKLRFQKSLEAFIAGKPEPEVSTVLRVEQ